MQKVTANTEQVNIIFSSEEIVKLTEYVGLLKRIDGRLQKERKSKDDKSDK